ncbi:MAG TPA: hypothetical protein VN848_00925 [Gemmatimonadales bacterium]|nr:hypothetical protein [Gemmatimonadales bacterium]
MRWTFLIALAAASCASTHVVRSFDSTPLPPICPAGVAVYPDSTQIHKQYTRIATLSSRGSFLFPDEDAIFQSQRNTAAKLGANGVILLLGNLSSESTSLNSGRAIAIYIPSDTTRVAAACGRH